ncbi:MAG: ATP-binding protein [Hyphomonadaceae bacterium]|nr:ATP-binding protein [Hyphomonadaceae bacterium]
MFARDLAQRLAPLPISACGHDAYERFSANPSLLAIAVVDDANAPVGMVTRSAFLLRYAETHGRALYQKRPITLVMNRAPLCVDENDTLLAVGEAIAAMGDAALPEGLIVTRAGAYAGVSDGLAVLQATLRRQQVIAARSQALSRELDRILSLQRRASDDLPGLMAAIVNAAADALGVARCSLWLMADDEGTLACAHLRNDGPKTLGIGDTLCAGAHPAYFDALRAARTMDVCDAMADPRTADLVESYLKPNHVASLLDASVWVGGALRGVLCCESVLERRTWTAEEASFVASLAEILALAFHAQALAAERGVLEARVSERTKALDAARLRAEEGNLAKSQFLANMSHELRTPLNAIIGYTEIVREDLGAGDAQQTADLDRVLNAASHLLHMINEVLDLSKIEAGRMEVAVQAFDVRTVIEDVVSAVRPMVLRQRCDLVVDVDPGIGGCVSDPVKLKQCLLNLLSNAAKFTQDGVVALRARVAADDGAALLAFDVIDTGIGIPPGKMARLFQPFVQADASITRAFGGTGLGLSITQRLAELLGGRVTLDSVVGLGSRFTLVVAHDLSRPAAPAAEGAAAPPLDLPSAIADVRRRAARAQQADGPARLTA